MSSDPVQEPQASFEDFYYVQEPIEAYLNVFAESLNSLPDRKDGAELNRICRAFMKQELSGMKLDPCLVKSGSSYSDP